jgi:hypothetical protein
LAPFEQPVYRGFQIRQQKKPAKRKWADVVMAALTIQRAYRKYRARKDIDLKPHLPISVWPVSFAA